MKCTYHPEVDAVAACSNCEQFICAKCRLDVGDKIYCNSCADKLLPASIRQKFSSLNWFQRHLNWTAVLAGLVWNISAAIEGSWLGWLIGLVVGLFIYGWILRQKHRSLWWILIIFVPYVGWIIFLSLANKSYELIHIKSGVITETNSSKERGKKGGD